MLDGWQGGWRDLLESVALSAGGPNTQLVWPLNGEDPDDFFSSVPYEKVNRTSAVLRWNFWIRVVSTAVLTWWIMLPTGLQPAVLPRRAGRVFCVRIVCESLHRQVRNLFPMFLRRDVCLPVRYALHCASAGTSSEP